jgi:hypothetical protein
MTPVTQCRYCGEALTQTFVDLGSTPLANSYVSPGPDAAKPDPCFPLRVDVCSCCYLVQTSEVIRPEAIFIDYAYFSSFSDSWLKHVQVYSEEMTDRFRLRPDSLVVEVASNDGYLLQYFANRGVPVLGIEPAVNVAAAARKRGIPTEIAFFGRETAERLRSRGVAASLMPANNVLAHVPDIRDFVEGFAILLTEDGVATFEFPHLLRLIEDVQFDTIYHEHFSYLSLLSVERILQDAGLRVYDVEKLSTHGGSLRVFACRADASYAETKAVEKLRQEERAARLGDSAGYSGFAERVQAVKHSFQQFLDGAKQAGKRVAAYGAAAKGNTFLNVCGVTSRDIICVFDRSPAKQGKLLPGSRIEILPPEAVKSVHPDYLLILPWNLAPEITQQMAIIKEWGGQFVTAVPQTRVFAA